MSRNRSAGGLAHAAQTGKPDTGAWRSGSLHARDPRRSADERCLTMLMRILRRGLAMLGIAALATGAATAPAQTAAARPALWQVSDRDTTVYLFGTIHLLPKNYSWRTPRFDRALAKSQTLVVETIVDNKNPAALGAELFRLGSRPGLPPLADRVPPDKRPL